MLAVFWTPPAAPRVVTVIICHMWKLPVDTSQLRHKVSFCLGISFVEHEVFHRSLHQANKFVTSRKNSADKYDTWADV